MLNLLTILQLRLSDCKTKPSSQAQMKLPLVFIQCWWHVFGSSSHSSMSNQRTASLLCSPHRPESYLHISCNWWCFVRENPAGKGKEHRTATDGRCYCNHRCSRNIDRCCRSEIHRHLPDNRVYYKVDSSEQNGNNNNSHPSQTCVTFTHWWRVVSGQTIWFGGHENDSASVQRNINHILQLTGWKRATYHTVLCVHPSRLRNRPLWSIWCTSTLANKSLLYLMIAHPRFWNAVARRNTAEFSRCTVSCTYIYF